MRYYIINIKIVNWFVFFECIHICPHRFHICSCRALHFWWKSLIIPSTFPISLSNWKLMSCLQWDWDGDWDWDWGCEFWESLEGELWVGRPETSNCVCVGSSSVAFYWWCLCLFVVLMLSHCLLLLLLFLLDALQQFVVKYIKSKKEEESETSKANANTSNGNAKAGSEL